MAKICRAINNIEHVITMACVSGFTILLFCAAVMRAFGHPISWDNDVALFLLTWSTFLGGDIAFRSGRLVNTGLIVERFPLKFQKAVAIFVYLIILVTLSVMIVQGIRLCRNVGSRTLEGVPFISYSWVVMSIPVSFGLMVITAVNRLVGILKSDDPKIVSKM